MANNLLNRAITWGLSQLSRSTIVAEYHKRGGGKRIDYTREAVRLNRKEVSDYINAVMSATDPENPRMGDWWRFKHIFKNDDHLISCVENRYMPVQCAPYKLVDKEGNDDEVAKKLLERPWMLDLVKFVICESFEGVKLLCMYDLNENGELASIEEIPQSNFIPQKGIIVDKEYDDKGTSYREGAYKNYYFQVGNDWNLGDYSGLATIVLAKKLALGSWLSYIDKYGVPPIFAITNRMDDTRRDELFEMLQMFRMNHFAVLQGDEKIETPQGYNVDAYNTFHALLEVADKAISKRLLGSSGLTDEKAYVGAAQAQEKILQLKIEVDKLKFKYIFNTEVKPRLIKLSAVYAPLANLEFEYDESESLTLKEILEAIKDLSPYYEFDIEEVEKLTGLPITKIKADLGMFGNPMPNPDPEEKEPAQKKKSKLNSILLLPPTSGVPMASLIYAASWNSAYDDLLEQIREGKVDASKLNKDFILKTYDSLNKAAQNGYGAAYYDDAVARKMRENLLQFAATKTHVQQKDLQIFSDSIENEKQYLDEAKKYLNLQNGQYLNVQQAWAARSAQGARQYQDWQKNKHLYPNVKFRTMGDSDVRPHHAELEGMTLPVDSPMLDKYMTPLDFNCRCWWEETRDEATDWQPEYTPDPQYQGNPGKTGEIFNEDNSYNQKIDKSERLEVRKQAELVKQYAPYNRTIKVGDNKVFVNDFADAGDLVQNIEAAKKMAEQLEKDIFIRHHLEGGIAIGHKNPELGIGKANTLGDLKTYDGTGKLENFIKNRIKSANIQNASYAVLDITKANDISHVGRWIKGSISSGNKGIKHVVVIKGESLVSLTRKQILDGKLKSLEDL